MLRKLSPEQASKCRRCEWRDKTNDTVVICPWARKCIKRNDNDIPGIQKSQHENESDIN